MSQLSVCFIVSLVVGCYGLKDKFVSITLDAKWSDTALHQEARYARHRQGLSNAHGFTLLSPQ